jgi:hypothetical protein
MVKGVKGSKKEGRKDKVRGIAALFGRGPVEQGDQLETKS